MRLLDADEIVAAIGRRAEDDAVSGGGQRGGSRHQIAGGQRRAVGIEQAHSLMPRDQQRASRAKQAGAEVRLRRLDETDVGGEVAGEEIAGACRRIGHPRADVGESCRRQQIVGDVAQERGVEVGGLHGRQRRDEARLRAPRNGGLRHHCDSATGCFACAFVLHGLLSMSVICRYRTDSVIAPTASVHDRECHAQLR